MPTNPDSDNHLVEQPAMALLAELGWQTACGLEETSAPSGSGSSSGSGSPVKTNRGNPAGDLAAGAFRSARRAWTTPMISGSSSSTPR